ncbi:hypothetical protein COHA_008893 [Chlorella ohadii]|uniref:DDRGK domain-containing protein 1 n=1 Tax=Chlorella ohadii TaxID=2649997 RepID=A0AAD5DJ75_9CHLO|nr:hypothetical protein COHA_008893 [Chlorella ohadii]
MSALAVLTVLVAAIAVLGVLLSRVFAKAGHDAPTEAAQPEALGVDVPMRGVNRPAGGAAYEARRAARDAEREAQEAAQEEEIRRAAEERARREEEEAQKWMHLFSVEAAGEEALSQEESAALQARFVDYVKARKTVGLDELAAEFRMKTAEVVKRVQALEAEGALTGIMDDRGKFIFVSPEEMAAVADFIRQRGRIAISELAAKSNQFIDLEARAAAGSEAAELELGPAAGNMAKNGAFLELPAQPWELQAAALGGLTLSQLRFFISFMLSVVLGAVLKHVPSARGRHIFSLVTGVALIVYPFGSGCMHAFVPAALEGHLDFTGAQMVLTLRLIAVAVSYQDGGKPAEQLQEYAARKRLRQLPSPLEFFSYLFAAGNLLAGPFFEASDFFDYVQRKGEWDERDPAKRIPSPLVPGLLRFFKGLICAALWTKLSSSYGPDLLESRWFLHEAGLAHKLFLLWFVGLVARLKYYFAWAVAESALIFSGLCYNGRTPEGAPLWNRYINSRIRRVEFNLSLPNLAANWNVCTGLWLRHYVYERLTPAGKRPGFRTLVATQLVSGVWHGLFPGYWLFFATSAVMFEAGKTLYRYEQTWPAGAARFPPYIALKVVVNAVLLNYSAAAFQVLWLHDCLAIWRSVHFLGHIAMLAIILLGNVVPPRRVRRELQPEQAGARAAAAEAAAAKKQAAAALAAGDGMAAAAVAASGQEEKKEL